MGKLSNFSIVYSTQPPVYFPGQTVSGVVNVTLTEDMRMRQLRLMFKGEAKVGLLDSKGRLRCIFLFCSSPLRAYPKFCTQS